MLGKENLTAQRPAVFIFNHRNQADPMIAGRLVSDNFTSVGKKELENDPIVGTMGKMMDAAFIDRDDPQGRGGRPEARSKSLPEKACRS